MSAGELFDKATSTHPESTAHTTKSDVHDVLSIAKDVQFCKILTAIDNREHKSFPGFATSPLKALNRKNLEEWIKKKVKDHTKLQPEHSEDTDDECTHTEGEATSVCIIMMYNALVYVQCMCV